MKTARKLRNRLGLIAVKAAGDQSEEASKPRLAFLFSLRARFLQFLHVGSALFLFIPGGV